MIRCCVFDLDGTLLNTTYALQRSMNLTLAEFGLGEISLAQVKQYVGNGSLNYCRRALDFFGADTEALLEPVSRRYAELFQQHCGYRVEPYEGMREALAFLDSRGAKLAVLSNKPDEFVAQILRRLYPGCDFLEAWGQKPQYKCKPDPEALHAMLALHGISTDECVYVGDSDVDVFTAQNSGVKMAGVSWGFRGREELLNAGAPFVADTADELAEYILSL